MGRTKRLKELTIKDNFMFGAVMMDEDNCKGLLERVLEIQIDRVDVSKEKSIVYHPEYKGVRLDVYAKDERGNAGGEKAGTWKEKPLLSESDGHGDVADRRRLYGTSEYLCYFYL